MSVQLKYAKEQLYQQKYVLKLTFIYSKDEQTCYKIKNIEKSIYIYIQYNII